MYLILIQIECQIECQIFKNVQIFKNLFVLLLFFALASILTARFNRKSIKERKNALFHARSGNGP